MLAMLVLAVSAVYRLVLNALSVYPSLRVYYFMGRYLFVTLVDQLQRHIYDIYARSEVGKTLLIKSDSFLKNFITFPRRKFSPMNIFPTMFSPIRYTTYQDSLCSNELRIKEK